MISKPSRVSRSKAAATQSRLIPYSAFRLPPSALGVPRSRGFTLIEIMVAVGIIAIILAVGIPAFARIKDKDSMRKAVEDVVEFCGEARARAVLDACIVEVRIRPLDRSFTATSTGAASITGEAVVIEERSGGRPAAGGAVASVRLSDRIFLEEALVFDRVEERANEDEVIALFYPDGTCDRIMVRLRSDTGEIRVITTEVVTGVTDVEVVR